MKDQHGIVETNETKTCKICFKEFASNGNLNDHMKRSHESVEKKHEDIPMIEIEKQLEIDHNPYDPSIFSPATSG